MVLMVLFVAAIYRDAMVLLGDDAFVVMICKFPGECAVTLHICSSSQLGFLPTRFRVAYVCLFGLVFLCVCVCALVSCVRVCFCFLVCACVCLCFLVCVCFCFLMCVYVWVCMFVFVLVCVCIYLFTCVCVLFSYVCLYNGVHAIVCLDM